jgi:NTP pyrophosphatase (non-canonical NTP hydrolase)
VKLELFKKVCDLADRKNQLDKIIDWQGGSEAYLSGLKEEIKEVEQELKTERLCFLEDELADVLWDYVNLITCLKEENNVSMERVFSRCIKKYGQRLKGIDDGVSWAEVKANQKKELDMEHKNSISR